MGLRGRVLNPTHGRLLWKEPLAIEGRGASLGGRGLNQWLRCST